MKCHRKRNLIAKDLLTKKFRARIIENKKNYTRKIKHKEKNND